MKYLPSFQFSPTDFPAYESEDNLYNDRNFMGRQMLRRLSNQRREANVEILDEDFRSIETASGTKSTASEERRPEQSSSVDVPVSFEEDNRRDGSHSIELEQDTYSFMLTSNVISVPFCFALFIFSFQMGIIFLVVLFTIDVESNNPLNVPFNVDLTVRCAQYLSSLIAVVSMGDITQFPDMNMQDFYDDIPYLRPYMFWICTLFRLLEAMGVLLTTFCLIVSSSTVIDIFMNFAAMMFIADVDALAFYVANIGILGGILKRETEKLTELEIQGRKPHKCNWYLIAAKLISFTIFGVFIGGLFLITLQQLSGVFLCKKINVQFDDEINNKLSFLSGVYNQDAETKSVGRVSYIEERPNGRGRFGYCKEESSWTFSFDPEEGNSNPCNWIAKSPETSEYDIANADISNWEVKNELNQALPFVAFTLLCIDCDQQTEENACSGKGICTAENKCECENDRFGLSCEFTIPCETIEIDIRQEALFAYTNIFNVWDSVDGWIQSYERPIYISEAENEENVFEIVMFVGRRWVAIKSKQLNDFTPQTTSNEAFEKSLADYFNNEFHALFSDYQIDHISGPTDALTPDDDITPIGLPWFLAKIDRTPDFSLAVPSVFLCAICEASQDNSTEYDVDCFGKGVCMSGTCDCILGTFGVLCQAEICRSLTIVFDDIITPELGSLSGFYEIASFRINEMPAFYDKRSKGAIFAYCVTVSDSFWAFMIIRPNDGYNEDTGFNLTQIEENICSKWEIKSRVIGGFDVTELDSLQWAKKGEETKDLIDPIFTLKCLDCDRDTLLNADYGVCYGSGVCVDNGKCICNQGKYGWACNYIEPPSRIMVDRNNGGFPNYSSEVFYVLQNNEGLNTRVYGHPIYIQHNKNNELDVIVFTGIRWIITRSSRLGMEGSNRFLDDSNGDNASRNLELELSDYMATKFHGKWSNYDFDFISDPIDRSPKVYIPIPQSIQWYQATGRRMSNWIDRSIPIDTTLLPSFCDEDKSCLNGGACIEGLCKCKIGFYGAFCDKAICGQVQIIFGTKVTTILEQTSGVFTLANFTVGDRPVYRDKNLGDPWIMYCDEEDFWAFTYQQPGTLGEQGLQPCFSWYAKSPESHAFDITRIQDWMIVSEKTGNAAIDKDFGISCVDCNSLAEADGMVCNGNGVCEDKTCECETGYFGWNCENNDSPCTYLESASLVGFPKGWPNKWNVLTTSDGITLVLVYNRPVYLQEQSSRVYFILFDGTRWIMSHSGLLLDIKQSTITKLELAGYLSLSFDSELSNYEYAFFAEGKNVIDPVNLRWKDQDNKVVSSLICAICDEIDNKCLNLGTCNFRTGACDCLDGYTGSRCQKFHASCFIRPEEGIPFCRCDGSCGTCGYLQNPVLKNNCVTCADGSMPVQSMNIDGTGACIEESEGRLISNLMCFSEPSIGRRFGQNIRLDGENVGICECHESCRTCYVNPSNIDEFDPSTTCMSCIDGYGVKLVREENGIKMGVCASVCQTGLNEYC